MDQFFGDRSLLGVITLIAIIAGVIIPSICIDCTNADSCTNHEETIFVLAKLRNSNSKLNINNDAWGEKFLVGKDGELYSKGLNKLDDGNAFDDIALSRENESFKIYYLEID